MHNPHRQSPIEGIIISSSKPIFIDSEQSHRQTRHINTISTISKLPSFEPDEKITKILYSKFLVKGVKPINSGIMISKLKGSFEKKIEGKSKQNSPMNIKQRIVTDVNSNQYNFKKEKPLQKDIGIFQVTREHSNKFQKNTRPQTAFIRSQSSGQLNRPKSAAIHQNASQRKLTRPSSQERTLTKNRSNTAISRTNSAKNQFHNRFQLAQEAQNVRPILTISDDYSNLKNVNYIERNKRSASIKKNTYITDVQMVTQRNFEKKYEKQEFQPKKSSNIIDQYEKNIKRQKVTVQQRRQIQQKHKRYLHYLKENEPQQYAECMNYLISLDDQGNSLEHTLQDIGFGDQDGFQPSKKEVQQQQIQNFYQDFYNICVDVEYGIKKTLKKAPMKKQKQMALLNIYQCEQLLTIYNEIQNLRSFNSDYSMKIQRIKQITKKLSFFSGLKPDILANLLSKNFSIESVSENTEIIKQDSEIKIVYIILNGSVSKKNKQQQDTMDLNWHKIPQFFTTLFDGQVFGLPSKPQQKVLHYSIRTLQRCILMIFPYEQYRKALSSNQNIQDRIQVLKSILVSNKTKFAKEDYEIIAFQMQSHTFSAKEVAYRQGQNCSKLLLVAGGRVAVCFQYFLTRKKTNHDPLRKTRNQKIPNFKIINYRKKNLKNYQVVHENSQRITYYYSEIVQQKVRGDVLNWEGFYQKMLPQFIVDEDFIHNLTYSIISMHDNTKIYQLSPQKIEGLPQHINETFIECAEKHKEKANYERNKQQSDKWEKFKHSLVASILVQKQKL